MMERPVAVFLLVVLGLQFTVFAVTASGQTTGSASSTDESGTGATGDAVGPAPYRADEFPQWARDLRRAEIIAFGTLPFTLFFMKTAIDTYRYADNDWDRRYAPWPLKTAGAVEMEEDLRIKALVGAAVGSVFLAYIDHIIMRMKRVARERKLQTRVPPTIITDQEGWPPAVDLPAQEKGADSPKRSEAARPKDEPAAPPAAEGTK